LVGALIAVLTRGMFIVVNCTPWSAHSAAATPVKASIAAFDAVYASLSRVLLMRGSGD